MDGKEQRIAKLNAVQQTRKRDCIDRTEKAIAKLLQNQERLSFGAIARVANVSVSYLYKYPKLKERIQSLRAQQVKNVQKITRPQSASEKSKQVIIQQLRERLKIIEWEKKELEKQNERMTGELYRIGTKLDLFERINSENQKQAEEITKLKIKLDKTQNEFNTCKLQLLSIGTEYFPINQEFEFSNSYQENDGKLKAKLSNLGVKLNTTLEQIIRSKTQQEIDNAISAVEEYLATDKKVKSKGGLLRKALEESWIPNLTDEERATNQVTDPFSEWFHLAYKQGIVKASQDSKKGILVLEPTDKWTPLEKMIEQGWTLEYLQQRNKH